MQSCAAATILFSVGVISQSLFASDAPQTSPAITHAIRQLCRAMPSGWRLIETEAGANPPGYMPSKETGVRVKFEGPLHGVSHLTLGGKSRAVELPKEALTLWVMPSTYEARRAVFPPASAPGLAPEPRAPEIGRNSEVKIFEANISHVISWKTYRKNILSSLELAAPLKEQHPIPAYGYGVPSR